MKKIAIGSSVVLLLVLLWQRELIGYGIAQARGQLAIVWNARPIEEVMNDPAVADSLKQKIELVQRVRKFAIDSLGVSDSDSYRTLYDQQGKPVLWVVTACEPFSLVDKKWSFPIVGTFSYKGFFDHERAVALQRTLSRQGYDTGIRTVSAWSTLGFLDDPILSGLLFRTEGQVANTIIHELTHATVFIKDDLKFNENVASFVGDQGAKAFLRHEYGETSLPYREYNDYRADRKKYTEHMLRGTLQLDSLYQALTPAIDSATKAQQKQLLIEQILRNADTLSLRSARYQKLLDRLQRPNALPNNTFFKAFVRYQGQSDSLEHVFEKHFGGDIKEYVAHLKVAYGDVL